VLTLTQERTDTNESNPPVTINSVNINFNFYSVVRTVPFGMKLYNDERNVQVFNLFNYLLLSYMIRAFF
jgi:hypothetical protein